MAESSHKKLNFKEFTQWCLSRGDLDFSSDWLESIHANDGLPWIEFIGGNVVVLEVEMYFGCESDPCSEVKGFVFHLFDTKQDAALAFSELK